MENKFEKILFTQEQIETKINEMAKSINKHYKNKNNVLLIPIMDGSLVFAGKLILELDFDLFVKSTRISLYDKENKIDKNKIDNLKIDFDSTLIEGKDVLIIDDLLDTGNTINLLKQFCILQKAKSVKVCVLFKKQINPREVEIDVDWFGYEVPNLWIAGYGIDSKTKLRNFKHLGIVKNDG